ncbi:Gfo/Idh/MocA family oxidoreductase [Parvularcula sp. BGMRC 0090]|uniref:Gfo/Idh/MocA family oxidoreductase n=2 Tax=Parvularcula maris TaxID=2965077 RepID=A0A9X2RJT8_9PROT|nr:Gfo/Idh/MocA family oxidoreductase [Parvularcula maris]
MVGTGKIAGKHAVAISMTDKVELVAVASRNLASAQGFTAKHGGEPVEGFEALCAREDIDAVYIAVPTAAKEEIALEALMQGKHVLVEKPLASYESAKKLMKMARAKSLAFMDATHFTHNPRTLTLLGLVLDEDIGTPISLTASFHADVGGRENIRFDPELEPYGVLGDLGWYCARLVVDLVPDAIEYSACQAYGKFEKGALVGVTGVVTYMNDGFRLGFDCSFTAGAFAQDMTLVGTKGIISMDDFVHDWERARIGEEKPQFPAGFRLRRGRTDPAMVKFVVTPGEKSHIISMLEAFARYAGDPTGEEARSAGWRAVWTQETLDAIWRSLKKPKPEA